MTPGESGARAARAAVAAQIGGAMHPWDLLKDLDRHDQIAAFAFLIAIVADRLVEEAGGVDEAMDVLAAVSLNMETTT